MSSTVFYIIYAECVRAACLSKRNTTCRMLCVFTSNWCDVTTIFCRTCKPFSHYSVKIQRIPPFHPRCTTSRTAVRRTVVGCSHSRWCECASRDSAPVMFLFRSAREVLVAVGAAFQRSSSSAYRPIFRPISGRVVVVVPAATTLTSRPRSTPVWNRVEHNRRKPWFRRFQLLPRPEHTRPLSFWRIGTVSCSGDLPIDDRYVPNKANSASCVLG